MTDEHATRAFFQAEQPEYVFLAAAKVGGIEMCRSYNRQYGTRYLAAMPTNLYDPGTATTPPTAT